jgi:hypothetical protein
MKTIRAILFVLFAILLISIAEAQEIQSKSDENHSKTNQVLIQKKRNTIKQSQITKRQKLETPISSDKKNAESSILDNAQFKTKKSQHKTRKTEVVNLLNKDEQAFTYNDCNTVALSQDWDENEIYKGYKPEDEVISMRDRTSKHFYNSDGTISAFLFSGTSIHYYENGIWKYINNNITLNKTQTNRNYKFSNTENVFKSFFPKESGNQGIKVELKEGSIKEWIAPEFCWFDENGAIGNPVKANTSDGSVNDNKITYQSVFPYTDVQFTQSNDGRKMDIIINDKSALSNIPSNATGLAYSETIIIPEGWTIKTIKGKDEFTSKDEIQQISVFDETGFEIFKYELPIVYENKIQTKENQKIPKDKTSLHSTIEENENSLIQAYYKIEENENSIKIWTITPKEWLLNEERNFPIVIDPTANYYPQNASYWTGRILNSGTTKSDTYLRVRGGSNGRGWAKFDISSITDGSTINDVDMTYYKYSDDGTGPYIDVYQLSTDPVPANAATIWTDCADGNQYCNDLYEFSYGSHTTDLGTNADTDLSNQLTSDWFGIGTLADDSYSYWEYWYGYDNANSIYITVTYTIPSCTNPSSYTVTGGGSYCSGGGGVAVGLSDSQVGVTYQLYRGATPVGGTVSGTGSALNFGNQTTAGTYTVQTTTAGGYCAITMTGSAVVTALTQPSISVQPTNQTASPSTSATFTVTATGGGLSYQWQENTGSGWNNISNGGVYSGATSASLVITNPAMSMTGYQYQCIITNSCGTCTSNGNATLIVDYCTSTFSDNSDYTTNVTFAGIDHDSGADGGYIDNTGLSPAIVASGTGYALSVDVQDDAGTWIHYVQVWFDWNQDGDFSDAGEYYDLGSQSVGGTPVTFSTTVNVPAGATPGSTIMRVIEDSDGGPGTVSECGSGTYGETEDYTVVVDGCLEPNSVYASNITYNSATINWTAPIIVPANDYEYYYSTSSTPPAGSGTNNSDTDVDLSSLSPATTYYVWVRSDCGSGDYSSWTPMYQFTTNAAPCTISSLNFTGSSRTPTLDGGYYYFDVCKDETLTLQANATCTNCGSGTNYNWVINAYDGNGETDYASNPLDYDIDFPAGYDALLEIEGDACYISYPLRFRASDGPQIGNISATINGCSGDGTEITVGASGSSVEVEAFHGEVTTTLGVGAKTFIPDGPSCTTQCYESSVTFTDFAPGTTITSADDIRYLKINLEHSFIGDMQITLEGPGGCGSAIVMQDFFDIAQGGLDDISYDYPNEVMGWYVLDGTWQQAGYAYLSGGTWNYTSDIDLADRYDSRTDAENDATAYPITDYFWPVYSETVWPVHMNVAFGNPDINDDTGNPCTEALNPEGTGWDYCWSNSTDFSYANNPYYVYSSSNLEEYETSNPLYDLYYKAVTPSDESAGTNFYHPYEDFYTELAGCPMNGTWTIKVCDSWASDNGWIFEWSLALDPGLLPISWDYDVNLDYADWSAITDANFDFVTGTPLTYDLIPNPDLSTGTYGGTFTVYDEYGCGTDEYLDFNVTGMPPVTGVAAGDYVWAGFAGQNWDDDLNNWFVYDGANYNYASVFPDGTKNVHIVDYCSNPDPLVVNAEAFCKDLIIEAGKTLTMSPTTHYQLNISGDWNNEGTFIPGISTVNFNGTGTQNINTSTAGGETFYNLALNKTAGMQLIINNDITVENNLSLMNGIINTGIHYTIVTKTNFDAISDHNSDSYIFGNLRRYVASNNSDVYDYPIGTETAYRLAKIENHNINGPTYFDVKFMESFDNIGTLNPVTAQDAGTPYTEISGEGIWQISPDAAISSGSYDIQLYFDGLGNEFVGLSDNQFGVLKRPSNSTLASDWVGEGIGDLPPTDDIGRLVSDGFALRSNITAFSEFGIGKSDSPLPIELSDFNAECLSSGVQLNWTTESESNNEFFTVYRSRDAENYIEISHIWGQGNSNHKTEYSYTDESYEDGSVYYKLRQTDFDGEFSESEFVFVNCASNSGAFYIVPNPFKDEIRIVFESPIDYPVNVQITDVLGHVVFQSQIPRNTHEYSIRDLSQQMPGSYYLNLIYENKVITEKLIKM